MMEFYFIFFITIIVVFVWAEYEEQKIKRLGEKYYAKKTMIRELKKQKSR